MSFSSLGLSEALARAVEAAGYSQPTPVQERAIPAVLQGRDLMVAAQTGTGKTGGFALPVLERLFPEVDWDEQIEVPAPEAETSAETAEGSADLMPGITTSLPADEPAEPTSIATARSERQGRR